MNREAKLGDWIKDVYRSDRSLGYVIRTDHDSRMMQVYYPKLRKNHWLVHENRGHYIVI